MTSLSAVLLAFAVSMLLVFWVHPRLVHIAIMKNIVDNPDARKLQRRPVPVLGGLAVFFGIVLGIGSVTPMVDCSKLLIVIVTMVAMLYTGSLDDVLNLSPGLRFLIEIVAVLFLIFVGSYCIDDFQGLWGVFELSYWVAVPLTVVAAVGIINAINLIDGVNGLSSGYCIMACTMFGTVFYLAGDLPMAVLAAVSVGALIPFFLHNVFGKNSRMFIGDSGTLVMGTVMSVFVAGMLHSNSLSALAVRPNVGLVPFALSVLCIPVFDTLRVMSARIMRGRSPFQPDKTHLHHIFIRLGASHPAVTLAIVMLNLTVVLVWWGVVELGASIAVQLYVVVGLSLLFTFGIYYFWEWHIRRDTKWLHLVRRWGYRTHLSRRPGFIRLQKFIDDK